jgi:hypothetical protein
MFSVASFCLPPTTPVSFALATQFAHHTAALFPSIVVVLLPLFLSFFFMLIAQQRWARPCKRKPLCDLLWHHGGSNGYLPATHKVSWAAYLYRQNGKETGCLHQPCLSPHACTNHDTVHYANEGLCLHQPQVFFWAEVLPCWLGWKWQLWQLVFC